METTKNFFKKHGITKKDFPKGFLIFNGVTCATYAGILALSYRYRPLYGLIKQPRVQEFIAQSKNRYPSHYNRLNDIMNIQSKALINQKMVKTFVDKYKLDSEKLVHSMGETFIIYKLGFPIILPFHFWVTVHLLKKRKPLVV